MNRYDSSSRPRSPDYTRLSASRVNVGHLVKGKLACNNQSMPRCVVELPISTIVLFRSYTLRCNLIVNKYRRRFRIMKAVYRAAYIFYFETMLTTIGTITRSLLL